jgi:hypothetical protein
MNIPTISKGIDKTTASCTNHVDSGTFQKAWLKSLLFVRFLCTKPFVVGKPLAIFSRFLLEIHAQKKHGFYPCLLMVGTYPLKYISLES